MSGCIFPYPSQEDLHGFPTLRRISRVHRCRGSPTTLTQASLAISFLLRQPTSRFHHSRCNISPLKLLLPSFNSSSPLQVYQTQRATNHHLKGQPWYSLSSSKLPYLMLPLCLKQGMDWVEPSVFPPNNVWELRTVPLEHSHWHQFRGMLSLLPSLFTISKRETPNPFLSCMPFPLTIDKLTVSSFLFLHSSTWYPSLSISINNTHPFIKPLPFGIQVVYHLSSTSFNKTSKNLPMEFSLDSNAKILPFSLQLKAFFESFASLL